MNKRKISQEVRDFIQKNYEDMTDRELAKSLCVCALTISHYRKELGLVRLRNAQIQTFIEAHYLTMDNEQLSKALNQHFGINATKSQVASKLFEYGLKRPRKETMLQEVQDFIFANYQEMGNVVLSEQLAGMGHTLKVSQIRSFLKNNGLKRKADLRYKPRSPELRKKCGDAIRATWRRERFAMQNGLMPRTKCHYKLNKSGLSRRKFAPDQVRYIRNMPKEEIARFAKEHGVCRTTLRQIRERKTYFNVPD